VPAKTPEEINHLFRKYMREGDLDAVMSIYDNEAVFTTAAGELKYGPAAIREQLAAFAAAKADFYFDIKRIIVSGDIALTHNVWAVDVPQPTSGYAIEVSRRQPDGTWRWLIGDPFTVGRQAGPENEAGVPEEVRA
jgi:ketosteroid isomerase-like protein